MEKFSLSSSEKRSYSTSYPQLRFGLTLKWNMEKLDTITERELRKEKLI